MPVPPELQGRVAQRGFAATVAQALSACRVETPLKILGRLEDDPVTHSFQFPDTVAFEAFRI